MKLDEIKEPKTEQEKVKLSRKLYEELKGLRDFKDKTNWIEGQILYLFEKFNLKDFLFGKALSKAAFYAEIDVPVSTAQFKTDIYEFYVIKHGFKIEELLNANTKKLHRAIAFVRDWDKEKI